MWHNLTSKTILSVMALEMRMSKMEEMISSIKDGLGNSKAKPTFDEMCALTGIDPERAVSFARDDNGDWYAFDSVPILEGGVWKKSNTSSCTQHVGWGMLAKTLPRIPAKDSLIVKEGACHGPL